MKSVRVVLFLVLLILSSSLALGISIEEIHSFDDFNRHIPELNENLQEDPIILPPFVLALVDNEDVAVHVETEQGHIESFVISIYENYVTGITAGIQPTKLYVELDEKTVNEIIENPELAIQYYKKGIIKIQSTNTVKKTKLFVFKTLAKWFA
ncbi:MAG: hypothetical protein KC535_04545 [Nanoarchaeota archaeon]|nr:hypothetical protein [Nanoarchaeota archaeon]